MAQDYLRYDKLVEGALRGVVRTTLTLVAEKGLPANHALYVTFDTAHPDVSIPNALSDKYPTEMTIVLQHQYWDLEADDFKFSVRLSFNKVPQTLTIPFEAVTAFADPPVQFGLKFDATEAEAAGQTTTPKPAAGESPPGETAGEEPASDETAAAEVVNLDQFRKK